MTPRPLIQDDELWQILNWHPHRLCFSKLFENTPSPTWREWAKSEILKATPDQVLYLCRLLRLFEAIPRNTASNNAGVEPAILYAAFVSGYALCGVDRQFHYAEAAHTEAAKRHLILADDVDEWWPGMASGAGWKTYLRLTVAGRRMVTSLESAPPPPFVSQPTETKDSLPSSPGNSAPVADVDSPPPPNDSPAFDSAAEVPHPLPAAEKPIEKPSSMTKTTVPHTTNIKYAARNEWIYEQCMEGIPYKNIRSALKKRAAEGWRPIKSVPGITRAAHRHALQHNLPFPERRPHGRPRKEPFS
jgi:hypothetical protein